jgi:hypothetical protein
VWQDKRTPLQDHRLLLADQSPTLETRNLYHSAQSILQHRSEVLVLALRKHFVETFERQVRSSERGDTPSKPGGLSLELSLVDEEDFEQSLALNKAAARLRFDSVEELAALDQRMAALLRDPGAKDEGNPPRRSARHFYAPATSLRPNPKSNWSCYNNSINRSHANCRAFINAPTSFWSARKSCPQSGLG